MSIFSAWQRPFPLISVLLAALAPPALAEPPEYARPGAYLGLAGSYGIYTELQEDVRDNLTRATNLDHALGLNARVGYRAVPHYAFEAQFEWLAPADLSVAGLSSAEVESWVLTANSKVYLLTGRVQPFVLAGMGVGGSEISGGVKESGEAFTLRFAGGLDLYASRNWVLAVEAGYVLSTAGVEHDNYLSFGWGLQYRF